jgi:GT2 family glycosyltransferase
MKQAGWQVWYQPAAKILHMGSGSSKHRRPEREADLYRSRVQFFRKHYSNWTTMLLKLQLYCLTAIKIVFHGLLRVVSNGRHGRPVVSLPYLAGKLRNT